MDSLVYSVLEYSVDSMIYSVVEYSVDSLVYSVVEYSVDSLVYSVVGMRGQLGLQCGSVAPLFAACLQCGRVA